MNKQYEMVDGIAVNRGIGWCTHTSSPIKYRLKEDLIDKGTGEITKRAGETVWFCVKVSPGCAHCYSERLGKRWGQLLFTVENLSKVEPFVDEKELQRILGMKVWPRSLRPPSTYPVPHTRPAIFIEDMSDLWADFIPFEMIDRIMAVAALRPDITFQFLTKRTARMVEYFSDLSATNRLSTINLVPQEKRFGWPLPNVLLGFSAENQEYFDFRWADMRKLAAMGWKVFASIEPQIGPVDCSAALPRYTVKQDCDPYAWLSWAIQGGESGPGARPFDIFWMELAIEQFKAANVPLFCKQLGKLPMYRSHGDNDPRHLFNGLQSLRCNGEPLKDSHGSDWNEWPMKLRVREFPEIRA